MIDFKLFRGIAFRWTDGIHTDRLIADGWTNSQTKGHL